MSEHTQEQPSNVDQMSAEVQEKPTKTQSRPTTSLTDTTKYTSQTQLEHLKKARDARKRLREERDEHLLNTTSTLSSMQEHLQALKDAMTEIKESINVISKNGNSAVVTAQPELSNNEHTPKKHKKRSDHTAILYGKIVGCVIGALSTIYSIYNVVKFSRGEPKPEPWSEMEFINSSSKIKDSDVNLL